MHASINEKCTQALACGLPRLHCWPPGQFGPRSSSAHRTACCWLLAALLPRRSSCAGNRSEDLEDIQICFVSLPALSALLGLPATAVVRHSLLRRGAIIGSAAATYSTTSTPDILAWREL